MVHGAKGSWCALAMAAALGGCGPGEGLPPGEPGAVDEALLSVEAPDTGGLRLFADERGLAATVSRSGPIDRSGPFFQALGTNGRSCATCHVEAEGWTITPRGLQARFERTRGTDPVFRLVDGAVSPTADVSTLDARRAAYRVLLDKGLIRVGLGLPAGAEFELVAVDDPYGHAGPAELSLFRRPLPTTNLNFLSTVMWDARETFRDATSPLCVMGTTRCFAPLPLDLAHQANSATVAHAEAAVVLDDAQRQAIVAFATGLFTAQVYDRSAGWLDARGGLGGPVRLSEEPAYFGSNDVLAGDYRTGAPFTPVAMRLYDAWAPGAAVAVERDRGGSSAARAAVARGQALFNGKPILITGVKGLNDDLGVAALPGTCTTCHDAPNAGNHSIPMPLDIGLADASRRTPDLPLYTLRRLATGETLQTTDPGRALLTGKWADVGRFKGPTLRALPTRAPYFHNGLAADLGAVVDFYNTRFGVGFTSGEKADLVAFLGTL